MTRTTLLLSLLLSIVTIAGADTMLPEVGTPVQPVPKAFSPGEVLEYKLVWNGINAGKMIIKALPKEDVDGIPAWKFHMTVKTTGLADKIYTVRLNISSHLAEDLSCSMLYYADKVEGSRKKIQKFTYDWDKNKVHYQKNKTVDRGWRELQAKSYDPLGMFFAIRNMTFDETTKELKLWVSDGKQNVFSKASVVKKETIEVDDTDYDTYLVEPELKNLKGVFAKSKDAKLQLWLSADKYRIPVKIKSKVAVGSFTAELTKHIKGN